MLSSVARMAAHSSRRFLVGAVVGVVLYCAATVTFAWFSYRQYETSFRAEVEERLSAIAELKATEVAAWFRERTSDARYFVDNESLLALIRQFDAGPPSAETLHSLEDAFGRMRENHGYDWIGYYDAEGVRIAVEPAAMPIDHHMAGEVLRIIKDGGIGFLDVHQDEGGETHMAFVAPVHSPGAPRRRDRGAVVLRINAHRSLRPFLTSWPVPSDSAELLLVRREGDDVVYLDPRASQDGRIGLRRVPLTQTDLPAVRVLRGDGIVQSTNRLGVPVVAFGRPVEGTPWHLVASQSQQELLSPLHDRAVVTTTIAGLLLIIGVAAFGLVWREHGRRLEAAERKSLTALTTMAQVVEASPAVLFQWSPDGQRVTWVSPNVTRWGYSVAQLLANDPPVTSLVHPDDQPRVRQELETKLARGESRIDQQYRVVTPAGDVVWVDDRSTVVRDDSGAVVRIDGILTDITVRKQLEAQFVQAQKMETVGRLAGGVAHDFNNLLTVINGYAEFALMDLPEDHAVHGMVKEIHDAGLRAASLTRQLLAFSRRQVVQPVSLNLNTTAEHVQKMLQRLIGEDIRLTFDLEPQVWPVRADAGQIEQVLMNLAVNSRDAMPEGGTLVVTTRNVSDQGDWVLLAVADSGCGMDEATRARIFEPFFTTKQAGQGTGLGLATVYGIVTQAGGRIEVSSTPGRGTTMRLYFPREVGVSVEPAPATGDGILAGHGERVLVVEDEEALRRIARRILESAGYVVEAAEDGPSALARLEATDGGFDIVVSDVIMPRMSGHQLTQEISRRWPQLRVLLASGYLHDAFPERFPLADDQAFLAKPYSPASLTHRVREVLDRA
jgi:PAS domain S-box-containing protein